MGFNHYVDNVTSASIDVEVSASEYTEEREENTLSIDYLRDKTTMSLGYTRSIESDFDAKTLSINISQDMRLETISLPRMETIALTKMPRCAATGFQ